MIKNIIFDIGNVLINWNPAMIVKESFPNHPDQESLTTALFKSQIWYDLNLGNLTIKDAIIEYNTTLGLDIVVLNKIMSNLFNSLTPINETIALLKKLHALGIPLYSITDNVPELIECEKNKYDFFNCFIDITTSYEVKTFKPDPLIYKHLLEKHKLIANECLFIDDILKNVEGAIKVGMKGFQFIDIKSFETYLLEAGVL
jgi:putative hydrolase of the HAD superfamily